MTPELKFSVSEFIAVCNQTLEYAFTGVVVEGEVASFKINQGKWVFFDLKDANESLGCFLPVFQLRMPLTDGMKVKVRATPKLTKAGRFSLTVTQIIPVGEGSIKKSFELLKQKLTKEGIFDPMHKRPLPRPLHRIGVISSTGAAGYADFLKILNARWGGLEILTAHVQVQGLGAAEQVTAALNYFNQHQDVDVVAILRGGGSADDLAAFNDEGLARAIAASRIPVITGIGHEVDESLADLAADVRASTPSNAAELLTPDKQTTRFQLRADFARLEKYLFEQIVSLRSENSTQIAEIPSIILDKINQVQRDLARSSQILMSLSPEQTLARGYAIITGKLSPGSEIQITTKRQILTAEVKNAKQR